MGFDSSGIFTRFRGNTSWAGDRDAGTKITAGLHDDNDNDLANGLTECITKTGKSLPTVNIPWNGKKILNLGAGSAPTDAINLGQLQALRDFSSAIAITGSTPESILKFTGTTGPWGLSFQGGNPDIFFGVNTLNQWIWNDNAFGTGNNAMKLDTLGSLWLTSIDPDAGVAPVITLERKSPTPAANDYLGSVLFQGHNNALTLRTYGSITSRLVDPTTGADDSAMYLQTIANGVAVNRLSLHTTGVDVEGNFAVVGLDDSNVGGPLISIQRDTASPAASDLIGQIRFRGRDSTAATTDYAIIYSQINDPVNGSEDGSLFFDIMVAGVSTSRMALGASGTDVNGALTTTGQIVMGGNNVAAASAAPTSASTNMPIGTTVLAVGNVNMVRQGAYGIYLADSSADAGYIANTTPLGNTGWVAGTLLGGSWRVRGTTPVRNSLDTTLIWICIAERTS